MRTRRQATLDDLRLTIRTLPRQTRIAMLEGMDVNPIIVGAYSTTDGICPMLAAHRNGGRTAAISFAQAWDRVGFRDARHTRARRATERELLILRAHLEASLLEDEAGTDDLGTVRREHEALVARGRSEEAAPAPLPRRSEKPAPAPLARRSEKPAPAAPAAPPRRERPGDPDRQPELRYHHGWAWTRVFRRYDEYERALARLEQSAAAVEAAERDAVAAP